MEIGYREAEMMASRSSGTPWTFREIVGWVALDEVKVKI